MEDSILDKIFLKEVIDNLSFFSNHVNLSTFIINNDYEVVFCTNLCKKYTELSEGKVFNQYVTESNISYKFNPQPIIDVCKHVFQDAITRSVVIPAYYHTIHLLTSFHLLPASKNDKVEAIMILISRYDVVTGIDEYLKRTYLHKSADQHNFSYNTLLPLIKSEQNDNEVQLTELEQCIIYLILNKFSSLEIAEIMSQIDNKKISKSYIDKIVQTNLRTKFKAYNRPHLVKILHGLGYSDYIPKKIIQNYKHETTYPLPS